MYFSIALFRYVFRSFVSLCIYFVMASLFSYFFMPLIMYVCCLSLCISSVCNICVCSLVLSLLMYVCVSLFIYLFRYFVRSYLLCFSFVSFYLVSYVVY